MLLALEAHTPPGVQSRVPPGDGLSVLGPTR